jgi:L,D-transpeptidase ErfK/SrfK
MSKDCRLVAVIVVVLAGALADGSAARRADPISSRLTGGRFEYRTAAGDSLISLGARYGIDPREIARANGVKPGAAIQPGSTLRLDNRHIVPLLDADITLVINIPQRMLFLSGDEGPAGFPVAVGRRDWQTPIAEFTVLAKEENPTWDVPVSIQAEMRREGRTVVQRVPPGPANPLGAYWLGLSLYGVGVHGTNAPLSIFRYVTHGCIRMHPDDIARVYPSVPLGGKGRIVYEPILLAQTPEGIFLEAHPDTYRRMDQSALSLVQERAAAAGITREIDWAEAARVLEGRRGVARRIDAK